MNKYFGGGGYGGSEGRLLMPRAVMSDTSSSQRVLLEGPYPDQTLGPHSGKSGLSPYGSSDLVDLVVRQEFSVDDEGILPQLSLMDDAALRLQMLCINNKGAGEGASTSGPDCGPHRPMAGSPVYANSIYSPRFQSTVLSHHPDYQTNGTGPFHDSSSERDGIVCTNTNSFWADGYSYSSRFQCTAPDHQTEHHPSGTSLFHDPSGEINGIVNTNMSSVWPAVYNRTASWPQILICPSLRSLRGRIVELACDREWCKFLQKMIQEGLDEGEIEILFREIIEHLDVLMTHRYANYIVQQLVEVCSEQQRYSIISMLTAGEAPLIVGICFHQHGTRVVQKMLDNANSPLERSFLLSAIAPNVVELTKNMHGQHVILHCLEKLSDEDNELLYSEVAKNCCDIATDKHGCCVIKKCIDFARGNHGKLLVDTITAQALYLSVNYYGNYVVQHILMLKMPGVTARLISHLEGRFSILSCDKFASNVVESCLRESGKNQFVIIIDELLRDQNYMTVFLDQYGNYVFTLAVEVSKKKGLHTIFNIFQEIIQKNAKLMIGHFHGKKALARLEKNKLLLPETFASLHRF